MKTFRINRELARLATRAELLSLLSKVVGVKGEGDEGAVVVVDLGLRGVEGGDDHPAVVTAASDVLAVLVDAHLIDVLRVCLPLPNVVTIEVQHVYLSFACPECLCSCEYASRVVICCVLRAINECSTCSIN